MKKYFIYIFVLLAACMLPSCLNMNLEDLPAYSEAEILDFKFEYRWYDESVGLGRMYVQDLTVSSLVITSESAMVSLDLTVPAASENFPVSERDKVTLANIVGYCDISTAAVIAPVGNAPRLGVIGDFSEQEMSYKVTAADGTEKTWTVTIGSFNK